MNPILTSIVLAFILVSVYAAPVLETVPYTEYFQNTTGWYLRNATGDYFENLIKMSFVPEPRRRGTVGILTGCITSLCACIWTGVHVDIIPNASPIERQLYKTAWAFVAFIAPEFLVVFAFTQRREAKRLLQEWKLLQKNLTLRKSEEEGPVEMDMQLAYFIFMGGYVVRRSDGSIHTLTPKGFIFYAEAGHIASKHLDSNIVADKSNADTIGKILSCSQVLWIAIQSVARRASQLPVTLLETYTSIQVTCMIFMYLFWLSNPMDIQQPVAIPDVHQPQTCMIEELPHEEKFDLERALVQDPGEAEVGKFTKEQTIPNSVATWIATFSEVLHKGQKRSIAVVGRFIILASYAAA